MQDLNTRLEAAALTGMTASVWADLKGDDPAIVDPFGVRTFAELNANANRLVRFLRKRGLEAGDAIALISSNRAEFAEVLSAALRGGFRLTPVNWRLTADEAGYIVADCQARAVFAEARFAAAVAATPPSVKVAIGGAAEGFVDYAEALAGEDGADIADPAMGGVMLYTSGTTGRPKGVWRQAQSTVLAPGPGAADDVQLCVGPAYHAAPLAFDVRSALAQGSPLVFLDRWDSEGVLDAIARHRVTRCHLVPIMFQRLLALPDAVKAKYDLSSLRYVVHGAAPCPPEVKKAMIDWWGPILIEYYAGSEGGVGLIIDSETWLAKPGAVGRMPDGDAIRLYDEAGELITERGRSGAIYMKVSPVSPFEYFNDPAKTASAHRDGYFTLGDVGYLDEDDFLFLTGRTAECIISGGVNIYPQEIDNEIIKHPAVEDSCVIGAPNAEWGEEVKAVVSLRPGHQPSEGLAAEIVAFARARLAHYKAPRSVDFVSELPRNAAGKIQRGKVRAPYWAGRERQI